MAPRFSSASIDAEALLTAAQSYSSCSTPPIPKVVFGVDVNIESSSWRNLVLDVGENDGLHGTPKMKPLSSENRT
jgi:hypothetical protein